ncbi:hypothetical protein F4680DRAFT_6787 [Xylaria scruposa]|nr:hypothetical protein F4680DRAFT_6787 [Xylaria scruposa]
MSEDEQTQVSRPSRYRSLRKQTVFTPTPPPNATRTAIGNHDPGQQQGNAAVSSTISRSMSRYRRRAASVTAGTDNHVAQTMPSGLENAPPVPAIPSSLHPAGTGGHHEYVVGSSSAAAAQSQLRRIQTQQRARGQTTNELNDRARVTYDGDCNGPTTTSGQSIQDGSPAQRDVSWEERDRLLEEQKRKDLQRLEEELENSQKRARAQSHKFIRSPVVEKFMALTKGTKTASHDGMSSSSSSSPASPMTTASAGPSAARRSEQEPARALPAAAHIEPGGRGIVPQKDAPTSASNAGGRNVVVRYRHHHTLSVHVTPETTAVDLMIQASSQAAHDVEIDPERCLVLEQYSLLGLERRLRRYERIRDVMNSWDSDAQNQLAIMWPDPHENHQDLLVSAVVESDEPPSGCQLYMYHSSRPGKWNKRWITMLQTGQIVCAKKPNAKATDKDTVSLCHLSDYDIYTPTESQMRRHIKPPKRFCFAIKSQHKTTLFLNTDNYVQYFSTEDPAAAHEFEQRAHGWRSWYLVDRHPDARKKKKNNNSSSKTSSSEARAEYDDTTTTTTTPASPPTHYPTPRQLDNTAAADGQRSRVSVDETPYSIGQFEPLLDLTRFDTRLPQLGKEVSTPQSEPPSSRQAADQRVRRRLSKREKPDSSSRHPPVSARRESEDGFTGGLLGEEYDNRKQALSDLDKNKRPSELAFTEGASLLNSQQDRESGVEKQPEPPSWFPSTQENTATQRPNHQIGATARPPMASGHGTGGRHHSLSAATHRPAGLGSSSAARSSSAHHASQHTYSRTHMEQPHPNPLKSQPTGLPYPDRHAPAKPLVDLTPTFQEPPQWSKEKKGHGVKPPEGVGHLVDFISAGTGTDSTSNRSIIRRPTTSGSAPLGRTRSMSAATSSGRPLLDDIPPVPFLPSRLGPESDPNHSRRPAGAPVARDGRVERRETVRHREREQERVRHRDREQEQRDREYREREAAYNAVPGRMGTLKVV